MSVWMTVGTFKYFRTWDIFNHRRRNSLETAYSMYVCDIDSTHIPAFDITDIGITFKTAYFQLKYIFIKQN